MNTGGLEFKKFKNDNTLKMMKPSSDDFSNKENTNKDTRGRDEVPRSPQKPPTSFR
jgi:hypothetical protein